MFYFDFHFLEAEEITDNDEVLKQLKMWSS